MQTLGKLRRQTWQTEQAMRAVRWRQSQWPCCWWRKACRIPCATQCRTTWQPSPSCIQACSPKGPGNKSESQHAGSIHHAARKRLTRSSESESPSEALIALRPGLPGISSQAHCKQLSLSKEAKALNARMLVTMWFVTMVRRAVRRRAPSKIFPGRIAQRLQANTQHEATTSDILRRQRDVQITQNR